jgi:tetratricopeptide (TPR) repeat protein
MIVGQRFGHLTSEVFSRPQPRFFIALLCFFSLFLPSWSGATTKTAPILNLSDYPHLQRGFGALYNYHLDEAEREFRAQITAYPDHPAGYLARGLVIYQKMFWVDRATYAPQLKAQLNETIGVSKKFGNRAGQAVASYFYLGMSHGTLGIVALLEGSYWSSYWHGKAGRKYLKKVLDLEPSVSDAYLGLGMFDYYAATLPRSIQVLSKIVGMDGDKARGIEELKIAQEKGNLVTVEAAFFLFDVYMREGQSAAAQAIIRELAQKYPDNSVFLYFYLSPALSRGNPQPLLPQLDHWLALYQTQRYKLIKEYWVKFLLRQVIVGLEHNQALEAAARYRTLEQKLFPLDSTRHPGPPAASKIPPSPK